MVFEAQSWSSPHLISAHKSIDVSGIKIIGGGGSSKSISASFVATTLCFGHVRSMFQTLHQDMFAVQTLQSESKHLFYNFVLDLHGAPNKIDFNGKSYSYP